MTIGIAIVIAMVLYLIDRNKVWKQAAKIVGALILLAVLGVAGIVGWIKYDSWQTMRKEAATQAILSQKRATFDSWYDRLPDCKRVITSGSVAGQGFVFGKSFVNNGTDMLKMKRDIESKLDFVSPDNTAAGRSWDSMETNQPCKGTWASPSTVSSPTVGFEPAPFKPAKRYAWSTTAVKLTSEAVEGGMVVGKLESGERVEVVESNTYGVKVRTSREAAGVYLRGNLAHRFRDTFVDGEALRGSCKRSDAGETGSRASAPAVAGRC